jgi:hypothetical protein
MKNVLALKEVLASATVAGRGLLEGVAVNH